MITVDGSLGEGGGQVLRTAVALSAVSGEPVRVSGIRRGRSNPGLRPQHLKAVEGVGLLCDASVEGLSAGSTEVAFAPGGIRGGALSLDVGTAGSATLVLQALLPVALSAPAGVELTVRGGTDVSASPTADYFRNVFLGNLRSMGCEIEAETALRGFYPRGGGEIRVSVKPWKRGRREFPERGDIGSIRIHSIASEHLRLQEVAERQVKGFLKAVSPLHRVDAPEPAYVKSESVGSAVTAEARCGGTVVGACVLGERGLKSEMVGRMAGESLLAELAHGAPIDSHMTDQIIPYLAIAGGRVRAPPFTGHAKTCIEVARMFGFDVRFEEGLLTA